MAMTNCPMCDSLLPTEQAETSKTCAQCGADISRFIRQGRHPHTTPSQTALLDFLEDETRRPARNGLYCLAAVWALPFIFITVLVAMEKAPPDSFNLTLGTISIVLCVMSVIAALKVGAGRKSGRLWAFLPIWVLMFQLPIGTIVAYNVHSRLGDANLN